MYNIFTNIYQYFRNNRKVMWGLLAVLITLMSIGASLIKFEEDINNFFPEDKQDLPRIFSKLKMSNRLVFFISTSSREQEYELMDCADGLIAQLEASKEFKSNARLVAGASEEQINEVSDFIYSNLPIFLNESDFARLDALDIGTKMKDNFSLLSSAMGGYIANYIYKDPLGIGSSALKSLELMGRGFNYNVIDDYIFSPDGKTLLFYVDPLVNSNYSSLIKSIESTIESFEGGGFNIEYFGVPAVAYYNAKQIKWDSMLTLNIAIIVVVIFILFAFRSRRNVILLLAPVLFGVIFSLSLIYLIQGGISLIAVGSGSVIFGLAFSYAIHFISHSEYCNDIERVIEELVTPLTIGSITTIGAFVGLLFTNSKLLQDFGLFSSLALIGTTLFTLIFLPQFVRRTNGNRSKNGILQKIYDAVGRSHENNKFLVGTILLLALLAALFYNKVSFDSNMMNLNYMPKHLVSAEQKLNEFIKKGEGESNVMFIATAALEADAVARYNALSKSLDSLYREGDIKSYSDLSTLIVSDSLQKARLVRWNAFWTPERLRKTLSDISKSEAALGFEDGAFSQVKEILSRDYATIDYGRSSRFAELFSPWLATSDSLTIFVSQVQIANENKDFVYPQLAKQDGVVAVDMSYFASLMSEDVRQNFYLVLYICALLIFVVLLLSYGRIELTLITFSPMLIAWIIIIGLMSLFRVEFNIVTIILSTFIFGIGDDFSIFVMDGLLSNYRDRSSVLSYHKRAIFIASLSLIIGMGALIFARHPAMQSLGVVSLIGMAVVVLVSYTIQPLLFRELISKHTKKGGFPFTLRSLLVTIYSFGLFVAGCFGVQLLIAFSYMFIWKKRGREELIHRVTSWFTHTFIELMPTVCRVKINDEDEKFETPAVIIANHQSFIDILLLLGMSRKFIMVTNSWVWNSPFFGRIVRFLGFFHTADGYENSIEALREKVQQGYSIVVFPEGTRSEDNELKRFHKGAFYIAQELGLDIIPILIYGTGLVSSKKQPLYIKNGKLVTKILPRIKIEDTSFGIGYAQRSKSIRRYFKEEYDKLYEEFNRASNPYFRDAIIKNYIYKGVVLEWYMRIKLRLESWYDTYDRELPRKGDIVDIGCGYGAMSYMLSMLSKEREITAVDYDEQKIAVAQNSFLKSDRVQFLSADIRHFDIPPADGYIISDVLHYIDKESQQRIIERCIAGLRKGGVILIREGDSAQEGSHKNTEATERWSTKYIKFNKTDGALSFISQEEIFEIAQKNGVHIELIETSKNTSNKLYKIRHING